MSNSKYKEIINDLYHNLGYWELYTPSFLLFLFITFITILAISYCYTMIHIQPIQDDWPNQRCKATILPFAGWIMPPIEGQSSADATYQNFVYCSQSILSSITGVFVTPITFLLQSMSNITSELSDSIDADRAMFDKVRIFFQTMTEELMARILNTTIPLQQMVISVRDMFSKIQGSMTAGLFTLLGSYYALKSLMGAIAQFIITILIALAAMIAVFWILPFTWGAAIANTAIFVAIAIPMALILAFMVDILKAQPDLAIPRLKCFDKNTQIKMYDETFKPIHKIHVGDKLFGKGGIVTAVICVQTHGSIMYELDGVIVSDSHLVLLRQDDMYIRVAEHPRAKRLTYYNEPYLYCLNTTTKLIPIDHLLFSDWDELYGKKLDFIMNLPLKPALKRTSEIHRFYDGGFEPTTQIQMKNGDIKYIKDVFIGDLLKNGEIVYGIAKISISDLDIYNYSIQGETFIGGPNIILKETKLLSATFCNLNPLKYKNTSFIHLLTNTGSFELKGILFEDYNSCIDNFIKESFI